MNIENGMILGTKGTTTAQDVGLLNGALATLETITHDNNKADRACGNCKHEPCGLSRAGNICYRYGAWEAKPSPQVAPPCPVCGEIKYMTEQIMLPDNTRGCRFHNCKYLNAEKTMCMKEGSCIYNQEEEFEEQVCHKLAVELAHEEFQKEEQ